MEDRSVFTNFKDTEGYFGVGKLPIELQSTTQELHDLFFQSIPKEKLQEKTYHQWYKDFSPRIKEIVTEIQNHSFWTQTCTSNTKCAVLNLSEMDELYYSKAPGKKRKDLLLYGATSNFDPHVDGIFSFPGVHFYRILIGLTPNKTVETRFLKLGVNHKLQENDYVIFDFDKAQHQVVNKKNEASKDYRIMLKLHFLVCDGCDPNSMYLQFVKQSYIVYEGITRYCMQTGTEPKTPYQFFIGLLCILGNNYKGLSLFLALTLLAFPLSYLWKRNRVWQRRLFLWNTGWIGFLLFTTFVLWGRYGLTGLR